MQTSLKPGLARYFANTLWLFVEKFFSIFFVLFISVWMARYLGPSDFGLLNFAFNFVALFSSLATLGLGRILERDLVQHQSQIEKTLSTSFAMIFGAAILTYALIAIVVNLLSYSDETNQLILIMAITCFFQINIVFTSFYYSQVMAKQLVQISVLALCCSNFVKVMIILMESPLSLFAVTFVLDGVFLFIFFLYSSRKRACYPNFSLVSISNAKQLFGNAWPYMLSGLLISIYMKVDTVMIKSMLGDNATGQYSAAARLSQGVYYLPTTILASIYPAIVNAKKSSAETYNTRLTSLYSMMFYMALAISIIVGFAAEPIVSILYGEQYNEAAQVLQVHIWACVFVFVGTSSGRWLLTENLQTLAMANTFFGTVINISLNLIFIPRYGIVGAAWATLISYGITGYICLFLWKRTRSNFYLITKSILTLPKIKY